MRTGLLPRSLGAVIIDLDGTLLDTEETYRLAFFQALEQTGWAMHPARYDDLVGLATPLRRKLLRALLGPGFPADRFFANYYDRRAALIALGIRLKPGANVLLDWLDAAGLPKAIATSASRLTAHRHLAAAGLSRRFEAIVTRDDVANCKPAPDSFIRAAESLDIRPARCLALEDSYHGILAASEAGTIPILIPDRVPPSEPTRARCLAVLPDLAAVTTELAFCFANGALEKPLDVAPSGSTRARETATHWQIASRSSATDAPTILSNARGRNR
jgi:HAD superfamily hydrolase (TIGR01509 family)